MKCLILHESPGRMRVHIERDAMTLRQADLLDSYLHNSEGIVDAKVYERTCDAVIMYDGSRDSVIHLLAAFAFKSEFVSPASPGRSGRELSRFYKEKMIWHVLRHYGKRLFIPSPARRFLIVCKAVKYILKGIHSLCSGGIHVELLDATAIAVSIIRNDFTTAGSVMFLLELGEILEEWTHRKSVEDLARTMALNVDTVWKLEGDRPVLVPIADVHSGDCIVVQTGNVIPLDGRVQSGEGMVNQASITGEPLPVHKVTDSMVFAGTVLEEGEFRVLVEKDPGTGRYDRIVQMVEESEKLKSSTEVQASRLADKLVPFSLGGSILIWLLTGNISKGVSVLMVDFSCALKLSMPLAVLSAMRECGTRRITVKGGKFLEAVAQADTIVFDKTGTLTHANPHVAYVIPFGENTEESALCLAACLEEHFPHSIANAVVNEAKNRGLEHEEHHTKPEYLLAHGIASTIDGDKVVIGSYHFVFEDEGCTVPSEERDKFCSIPSEYSHLYLARCGILAAVICIEDPVRSEAYEVIRDLHDLGFGRIVMMTGDGEKTACAVAEQVGVDEYYSEVLPEDKAAFIRAEHKAGRKVIMLGDGINDSPALSESDAGIAVSSGAAIAREVADITIAADDLRDLVFLRKIGLSLMKRIHSNYRFIMSFNGLLIGMGIAGFLPPSLSALMHNGSTIGVSLHSMTNLLDS